MQFPPRPLVGTWVRTRERPQVSPFWGKLCNSVISQEVRTQDPLFLDNALGTTFPEEEVIHDRERLE